MPKRLVAREIAVGNQRRISTVRGDCANAIETASRELPAKIQSIGGASVITAVKTTSPKPQTVTSRRAPYLVASSAPGIEPTPSVSSSSDVIEPVAE